MSESSRRAGVENARSFLFVPGNRPERFAKAHASGADVTILDLEDAVAPIHKEASRGPVVEWAVAHDDCMVRVNGFGTPWIMSELRALRGRGVPVMLPKAENVDQFEPGGGRARRLAGRGPGGDAAGCCDGARFGRERSGGAPRAGQR